MPGKETSTIIVLLVATLALVAVLRRNLRMHCICVDHFTRAVEKMRNDLEKLDRNLLVRCLRKFGILDGPGPPPEVPEKVPHGWMARLPFVKSLLQGKEHQRALLQQHCFYEHQILKWNEFVSRFGRLGRSFLLDEDALQENGLVYTTCALRGRRPWDLGTWAYIGLITLGEVWRRSPRPERVQVLCGPEVTLRDLEIPSDVQDSFGKKDKRKLELMRTLDVPLIRTESIQPHQMTRLGGGFYGVCYRVEFPDVDEPLILKTYKWNLIGGFGWKGMFWEAEALRKLDGVQGTPKLIAVDPVTNPCALVMTDCGNITYWSWVKKNAGDAHRHLALLTKISETLEEIHARGLCHNDLHGSNIVIDESMELPFIVDLGGMMTVGQKSWRTLFLPFLPIPQLLGMEPVSAYADILNFGRLMSSSVCYAGLEGRLLTKYRTVYKDCKKGRIKSAQELRRRIDAIARALKERKEGKERKKEKKGG
ncbi:uncharacterized protein [Macrobrachium rosenbergii]|uniref:uncharacterized protein n=1 Tax=Macrobrachium rosenbergii TaxID=79674 RepID=UPI0034D51817